MQKRLVFTQQVTYIFEVFIVSCPTIEHDRACILTQLRAKNQQLDTIARSSVSSQTHCQASLAVLHQQYIQSQLHTVTRAIHIPIAVCYIIINPHDAMHLLQYSFYNRAQLQETA